MKQSNIKDIEFDIKDGKLLLNIHKDFMIRYLSNNGDLSNRYELITNSKTASPKNSNRSLCKTSFFDSLA